MLTLSREVLLERDGNSLCKHSFLTDGFWTGLDIFGLKHTQEKICFNCGRYEMVITSVVRDNPFTFKAVANRFANEE